MSPERWKRVREIFDAAVQRSQGAEEFARAECGGDEELYSEVRRMLDAHQRSGFLDRPPAAAPVRAGSLPVFSEGQLVAGRYRIVRYLSRGGMGEVYEAEDLDLPEMREHVALKTLLPEIASDQSMVARFRQEIALSRKVQHPNVCGAFDLSRHEVDGSNPILFLTMRFLPGETLAERLKSGRMTPEEALPLLEQMADALDAAHREGVIHRDFKPSNVMLVPTPEGIRAVVTDFGLARRLTTGGDTTSTLSMNVVGTPDYMAPELFAGSIATFSSDVYALGMVAYKVVTGALPSSKQPVPPPRTRVPDLDPKWDRAILRAVDANPATRFSRASHFMQALRGEPVSMTVRLPVVTRRRAVAAGLAVVVLTGGLVAWRGWVAARDRPPEAAMALYRTGVDDIHAGAYFAATKALGRAVQIAPRFSLAHARLAEAWTGLEMTDQARQDMQLLRRQDNSGLAKIDQLEIEAVDFTTTREFPAAVAKYEQMVKLAGGNDPGLYVDLGRAYEGAGKPDLAIASYRRAAEGSSHNPAAWLRLAVLYSRASNAPKAEEAFRRAGEQYQLTSNLEGLTEVAFQQGIDANRRAKTDEGAAYLRKALDTARLSGNYQQEIRIKLQLSTNAYVAGDAPASELYAQEALDLARANRIESLATGAILNLGNAHGRRNDFPAAEKYLTEGLALAQGSNPRLTAFALLSLASLHDQLRRADEAAREAAEALSFYQLHGFTQESFQCLTILSRAEGNRGNYEAALKSSQQLLDMAEKAQNRSQMALAHESLGSANRGQEQFVEALKHFQIFLNLSADPEKAGYAALECGDMLSVLGRYAEASAMFEKAMLRAAKFASLRLKITRARAEMDLSKRHFMEASAAALGALAGLSSQDANAADWKAILGFAQIALGNKGDGLRNCDESLAATLKTNDTAGILHARLAVLEARLANSDRKGALNLFAEMQPALATHPETLWRALALASSADHAYTEDALRALNLFGAQLGEEMFKSYLSRPDMRQLSWPLLKSNNANHY